MESALAWLEPPSMAPVVEVGDQTHENHGGGSRPASPYGRDPGIRYDGLLGPTPATRLLAADLILGADARAAMLAPVVPSGGAVARQAAVWVHTGRLRPGRVSVVVAAQRRVHAGPITVHRQRLSDDDVVHLGGVPTTTPLRTAVDLLCFAPPEVAVAGFRLLLAGGLDEGEVRVALDQHVGLPVRRAEAVLALADAPRSTAPSERSRGGRAGGFGRVG